MFLIYAPDYDITIANSEWLYYGANRAATPSPPKTFQKVASLSKIFLYKSTLMVPPVLIIEPKYENMYLIESDALFLEITLFWGKKKTWHTKKCPLPFVRLSLKKEWYFLWKVIIYTI